MLRADAAVSAPHLSCKPGMTETDNVVLDGGHMKLTLCQK